MYVVELQFPLGFCPISVPSGPLKCGRPCPRVCIIVQKSPSPHLLVPRVVGLEGVHDQGSIQDFLLGGGGGVQKLMYKHLLH